MNIGKRIRKSGASSPGISEGPDNQTHKKGRVAPTKNDKDIVDTVHGDLEGEVFEQPPRGSFKEKVGKGLGVQDRKKDAIGFFLWFERVPPKSFQQPS